MGHVGRAHTGAHFRKTARFAIPFRTFRIFSHFPRFSVRFLQLFPLTNPLGAEFPAPPWSQVQQIPENSRAGIRPRGPNFLPQRTQIVLLASACESNTAIADKLACIS